MTKTGARRLVAFLDREALGLVVVAIFSVFSLAVIPQMLVQDTWLTLVSGREISQHGLPQVDALTVWARGSTWIDQQWLAQLLFFWTHEVGGIKLVALAHVAAVVAAIASAIAAARSLVASSLAVSLVAAPAIFVAPWGFQARAQTFAIPLFVWIVWLLAADSRRPSRRVLLVFPLLVAWANLHGTVVLAAALVAVRGVTLTVGGYRARKPMREWLPRGLALTFGPVACLVASPYGLDLVTYYRTMLVNSTLRTFVDEWGPATPSPETFLFFVLAFVTVGFLARFGHRLTATERVILLVTLASGLLAIRNIIWFALAAVILVPALVDKVLVLPPLVSAKLRVPAAAIALASAAGVAFVVAVAPASWYVREWPAAAGDQVVNLASDPRTRVLSDERYSDWLLWEHPELVGRVAYDVRFELFDRAALDRLYRYQNQIGADSGRLVDDFEVVAFDHRTRPGLVASLSSSADFRVAHRDRRITVLTRVDASEPAEDVQVRLVTRN
ncbi:MAG: hypothetical protein ABI717_00865 [Actinomycetota bacterium]